MKSLSLTVVVFSAMVVIMLFLSLNAHSGKLVDAYCNFDRWAVNFDPLGNALDTLNEIPGLKVSGSLHNWTFINTHGDRQVGTVDKDWRFQEIQWLGEIEPRYQLSPRVELVSKLQFMYDAIYDWQDSSLYADDVSKDSYISHTGDQIIRELHLDMEFDNWFLKLGKQQVVWGKMEGRWMDFVNNLDRKDGLQVRASVYNQVRIPLWTANVTRTFGKGSLQFLWIPDYEPDRRPYPGSPWWSPLRPDPGTDPLYRGSADEPSTAFKDHQWAVRYSTELGQSTWSLGYMYGFAPTTTNFIRQDNVGEFFYDPEYTRSHLIGSSIDFAHVIKGIPVLKRVPFVYRAEVVYKTDQYFADFDEWDPANRILKAGNGVSDTDLISGAMQFKFFFPGRVYGFYQPMMSHYLGWSKSLGINRRSLGHVFFINKTYRSFEDRLNTCLYTFISTGSPLNKWQGMKSILLIRWVCSDNIQIKLTYTDYRGGDNDLYGQFDLWDNVGWEIKYAF